ncbi:MAG: molybdopterin-dependent oxidoreductase [Pseudomonadales bacterium]|nr:molybdopterin-dependent oxidoreductase [Pseudomonadales bacterium]
MKQFIEAVQKKLNTQFTQDRRKFLKVTGIVGAGFTLATLMPDHLAATESEETVASNELNAFVSVSSDGKITIYSANAEMGQGIKTALPMIIAEEMGARWQDVEVIQSPINQHKFGRQSVGGSTTIPRTWNQMREMGASAREMFLSAGALIMELPISELKAADSMISHGSGRFMTFGQLATLAAKQTVPDPKSLKFKDRDDYTILGSAISGVDNLALTTGLAMFGIDTQLPGMLYAIYHKCPAIGGRVISANLDEVKATPGIIDAFVVKGNNNVRELLDGVAIVGTNTHAVFKAKQALLVKWDESEASKDNWDELAERGSSLHGTRGSDVVINKGNVKSIFDDPKNTTLAAFYEYPFVAHLCMEPMNCTANYIKGNHGSKDQLEIWVPHQFPERSRSVLQSMFGVKTDQIKFHQMRLGGSFGRRVYSEYICEVCEISKRVGAPVKLTWTREDDIHHDFFRTGGFQSVKGAINPEGKLVGFEDHYIGTQINGQPVSGSRFSDTEFPLQNIDNVYASKTMLDIRTPCGPWRAPGSNTTAFVTQSFLHELAVAGNRDFVEFMLEILGAPRWFEKGNIRSLNTGRAAEVIKLAARQSGWGRSMPEGSGLGMAFYFCHAAHIAEVAHVSVDSNKKLTVHKVIVAVDVGPIINMSGATSQVVGAVIDGLSTMMAQKITMQEGRIQQSNFHDYEVLRMPNAPEVDVHFIQSDYAPTGLGEPALPPLAPAVGNAIYAATGHRVRKMPISEEGYSF